MNRDMMAQLEQMQERMQKAQEELEAKVAEGTSGGGAVTIQITGGYKVQAVKIEPEVIDPDDVGMLEDLITAALNEALEKVQGFQAEHAAGLTGGLSLPGLAGLPGLGGAGGHAPGGAQPPMNRAARRANKR